jgi:hypothetical protein
MDLSNYKFIKVSGINMRSLAIDGVEVWRWAYKNWVPFSINADGTIYNNGLGYKDGYRVRSGGAETTQPSATITGYIKVSAGDIIRISGCNFNEKSVNAAINASDSSFTNIGQLVGNSVGYGIFGGEYYDYSMHSVVEEKTGVWRWIVPPAESGVAYIRITAGSYQATPTGADLIVTINEEII